MDPLEHKYISRNASGELCVEGVQLSRIAKDSGSPTYVYSKSYILDAFKRYRNAFSDVPSVICVSVKANSNLSLLQMLAATGAGFDVVSGGELSRVVRAGGKANQVVFAGVGKSDEEIVSALRAGILMFNVESHAELHRINELAQAEKTVAPVAIRVNPDVDAKTHAYISTGMEDHKFGIPMRDAKEIYSAHKDFANLAFVGVDCHIGSMITDLSAFGEAFRKVKGFIEEQRKTNSQLRFVDLGGGLAVPYRGEDTPAVEEYAQIAKTTFKGMDLTIIVEPGRSIFANGGVLLTRVMFVKQNPKKQFVIVDAGFNDLIRPALYEAHHEIEPVIAKQTVKLMTADVVGPICESGDCFAHDRELPQLNQGDLVVLRSAGAYGFAMSSNYNTRPRAEEVLVDGPNFHTVRRRETVDELFAHETPYLKAL